jgi:GTPase Era involved in 16S rRNA processing
MSPTSYLLLYPAIRASKIQKITKPDKGFVPLQSMHKAGFVNIIGNPNAGKSTLMNAFLDQKLSIITAKAQTTRHRIFRIVSLLPNHPPFFPKDQITDKPERFFVNEAIREQILMRYQKEIPYAVEVLTEQFEETENIIRIRSVIIVERNSQKGIVVGSKGSAIKHVGIEARKTLETFFDKKIHLELFVKVNKNWRSNHTQLQRFGYSSSQKK